jgi:hypothetical protein
MAGTETETETGAAIAIAIGEGIVLVNVSAPANVIALGNEIGKETTVTGTEGAIGREGSEVVTGSGRTTAERRIKGIGKRMVERIGVIATGGRVTKTKKARSERKMEISMVPTLPPPPPSAHVPTKISPVKTPSNWNPL